MSSDSSPTARRLKVMLLVPTLDQSGAEKQLTLLASRLSREEFDVHVVALARGGPLADELQQHAVRLTVLGKRWRFDPRTWWRLRRMIAFEQPDILHTWLFAANAYGRLAKNLSSFKGHSASARNGTQGLSK